MGRAALSGGLLLLTALGFVAFAARVVDCPECEGVEVCPRCEDRRSITPFDRGFRPASLPAVVDFLRQGYGAAPLFEELRRRHSSAFEWRGRPDYFEAVEAVAADPHRVLVLLLWKRENREDGAPRRFLVLDRLGRTVDGLDLRLDASSGRTLEIRTLRGGPQVGVSRGSPPSRSYFLERAGEPEVEVPAARWPAGWETRGLGRVALVDGRLALVPP